MKISKIKVGDVFTRLTVVKQIPRNLYDTRNVKRTLFECMCSCGTTKIVDAGNLKKGVKSCGCLKKELAIQKGKDKRTKESYLNSFYGDYKRSAKNRKLTFNLSKEYYSNLVQKDCYYCGDPPKLKTWKNKVGIPLPIHGVDRIDSSKGYEEDNTVSCCATCNTMKMALPQAVFYQHCLKIVRKHIKE